MLGAAGMHQLLKLMHQFFLAISQLHWRLDHNVTEKIARKTGAHALDAFAAQAEGLATLRTIRNRERHLAGQCRNFDFAT